MASTPRRPGLMLVLGLLFTWGLLATPAEGQTQLRVGQEGKDVPWVPTPDELVDTMLEMAAVTSADRVIDLGSGDGRLVIAAARLGARAVGVELEESLVALSTERAAEAGVADLTEFIATDLFEFDLSPATVITMFLLPDINYRLRPALFALEPGTRLVSNTWDLSGSEDDPDAPGWTPDRTVVLDPCPTWCTCCGPSRPRSPGPGVLEAESSSSNSASKTCPAGCRQTPAPFGSKGAGCPAPRSRSGSATRAIGARSPGPTKPRWAASHGHPMAPRTGERPGCPERFGNRGERTFDQYPGDVRRWGWS